MKSELSFEDLAGDDNSVESLAYWIGLLKDENWLLTVDADNLSYLMSLQYDAEEQAGHTGKLFAFENEDVWHKFFLPIAPVQLTYKFSPFPTAIDFLGNPKWISKNINDRGSKEISVFWSFNQLINIRYKLSKTNVSDENRLIYIMETAIDRAKEKSAGILLTAKTGWSYFSAMTFDNKSIKVMKDKGFFVVSRKQ